jgi:hypothetical protein
MPEAGRTRTQKYNCPKCLGAPMKTIDETRRRNAGLSTSLDEGLDAVEQLLQLQFQEIKRLHEENRQLTEANLKIVDQMARLQEELDRLRVQQ